MKRKFLHSLTSLKESEKMLRTVLLTMLIMLLANTSTVYAQKISNKKLNKTTDTRNSFYLDSLGLKEFSILIQERKKLPNLYKGLKQQLNEKDEENSLLEIKIEEYKENQKRFDKALLTKDENIKFIEEKNKKELKKIKWQRNKSYIIATASIVLSILVASN